MWHTFALRRNYVQPFPPNQTKSSARTKEIWIVWLPSDWGDQTYKTINIINHRSTIRNWMLRRAVRILMPTDDCLEENVFLANTLQYCSLKKQQQQTRHVLQGMLIWLRRQQEYKKKGFGLAAVKPVSLFPSRHLKELYCTAQTSLKKQNKHIALWKSNAAPGGEWMLGSHQCLLYIQ